MKFTLMIGFHPIKLEGYQSPRGTRREDKRPTSVKVEINEEFDLEGLNKLIGYLHELSTCMEMPQKAKRWESKK